MNVNIETAKVKIESLWFIFVQVSREKHNLVLLSMINLASPSPKQHCRVYNMHLNAAIKKYKYYLLYQMYK